MIRVWAALALVTPIVLAGGCFSGVQVTRYRSETYQPQPKAKTALMPLILRRARAESKSLSLIAGAIVRQQATAEGLSPAQYAPAAQAAEASLKEVLTNRTLVSSKAVLAAMNGTQAKNLTDAVRMIAQKTESDTVLVVEVNDFLTQPAGLENAQASGRTDIAFFQADGSLAWSLSAQVVRRAIGSNAAPSLTDYLTYVLDELEPEIQQMLNQ